MGNLGFHPMATAVFGAEKCGYLRSVTEVVIEKTDLLQNLAGNFLPMSSAVPRTNHLRFVGRVPPCDPPTHRVEEGKRRRPVRISSMLTRLRQLSPRMSRVLGMDNDEITCPV